MNRRNALKSLSSAALLPLLADVAEAQSAGRDGGNRLGEITPETVYELRIYHLNPGKQAAILERFKTREVAIFERLGMHKVAFWVPTMDTTNAEPGGDTLIYLLRHKSIEAAHEAWAKFRTDPEWLALKAETEKDGPLNHKGDSTFMKLTEFSPKV